MPLRSILGVGVVAVGVFTGHILFNRTDEAFKELGEQGLFFGVEFRHDPSEPKLDSVVE